MGLAVEASGFRTWCSPGAWPVPAAALGTERAVGKAGLEQQRERLDPLAGPVGKVELGLVGEAAAAAAVAAAARASSGSAAAGR